MYNELHFFDEFLHRVYPQHQHLHLTTAELETFHHQIAEAAIAMRNKMVDFVFETRERAEIELYIQHHQRHLTLYLDAADCFLHRQPDTGLLVSAQWKELLCLYAKYLEGLLGFMEAYFSRYFNQDEILPKGYLLPAYLELEEKLEGCRDVFLQLQIPESLARVSLLPVQQFMISDDAKQRTFRRLLWLKEFTHELLLLPERAAEKGLVEELLQLYVYLNFNSLPVYKYITEGYRRVVQDCVSTNEKTAQLSFFLKEVNLIMEKPGFALCPNRPSLKQMLQLWLQEELDHLKFQPDHDISNDSVKINACLSVAQFAYLVHLLEKCCLIHAENPSKIIQFFSGNFTTLHRAQISHKSFKNRYYSADRSTASSVRDMLLKMVHESKAELP